MKFLGVILLVLSVLFAQKADSIIGKYRLPNGIDIEIYKEHNTYNGKIIALNNYRKGQTKDLKNSDKSKRSDLLFGKVVLTNLIYDTKKKEWNNGKMYAPDKGIIVNLKIIKISKKEITVVGSKYFFWKTLTWKKIDN